MVIDTTNISYWALEALPHVLAAAACLARVGSGMACVEIARKVAMRVIVNFIVAVSD